MPPNAAANIHALGSRESRLSQLWFGFQHEISEERAGHLSLTTTERRDYLEALHAASVAVGAARKVLALSAIRIKEEDVKTEAENKRVAAEYRDDSRPTASPNPPGYPN
jgi:hypothetical protein